ncbi:hypothetical protein HYFRA_00004648 [Hymenoscyphus fraxineus]|uniref:Tyrosinase copper-binding domain-containing protein n=1 Tax=Hymenoscyphus fraxineus TaxID=746836 RepID=A0A9N9PT18_9HELO|nr:hypothetical protein HYFRA_00004648 [Hymenoscyphus fraxineus]
MRFQVTTRLTLHTLTFLLFCGPTLSLSPRQNQPKCENPVVRKEWNKLSPEERDSYIKAVSCLTTKPSKIKLPTTLYDDFTWIHQQIFDEVLAQFLPWHRYFGLIYETALKDCGYIGALPYWDWTLYTSDPIHTPILTAPPIGLGPDGSTSRSCVYNPNLPPKCVASGPFAELRPMYSTGGTRAHSLHRCYTCSSPTMLSNQYTPGVVNRIHDMRGFADFGPALFSGPHQAIHEAVGGDFPRVFSPNDPLFFPHHAQIDRLWWKWQMADLEHRLFQYEGFSQPLSENKLSGARVSDRVRMLGLAMDLNVIDLMDTQNGRLCYVYED